MGEEYVQYIRKDQARASVGKVMASLFGLQKVLYLLTILKCSVSIISEYHNNLLRKFQKIIGTKLFRAINAKCLAPAEQCPSTLAVGFNVC